MDPAAPIIKHRPEDFLVRENMAVALVSKAEASHRYFLLRKRGFTTMEASRLIAGRLGIAPTDVTYGGLKDEDAITEQLIGVPVEARTLEVSDSVGMGDQSRWMRLQHYGYGAAPLAIGELEGNGFNLVIRNLTRSAAEPYFDIKKLPTFFLNYYDIQRFGVPSGPKRTHFVGAALLAERWDDALRELIDLKAPESEGASGRTSDPEQYFRELDPRTVSFYLAAHESFAFNAALAEQVLEVCPGESQVVEVEGLSYRYVRSPASAVHLAAKTSTLPYFKYRVADGKFTKHESQRTTAVQVVVNVTHVGEDESFPDRFKLGVRFFLPSGSYATAVVRQITQYRAEQGVRIDGRE